MKPTLYLCGAGNYEGIRLALRINEKHSRWDKIILLDDDPVKHGKFILGVEVADSFGLLEQIDVNSAEVANLVTRTTKKRWFAHQKIKEYGLPYAPLIDPGVDVRGVEYTNDIMVYQNATFAAGAYVDEASVVLMGGIVGHGCRLGQGCVVAPGAVINARVQMEDGVYVGTNASILPDLRIGSWATIGINSAVVDDVPAGATVMGVPAQIIMTSNGSADRKVSLSPSRKKEGQKEKGDSEAKRSAKEKALAKLWTEVLGIEKFDIYDNFFDLGGDSILAIQIISKANQVGIQLSIRQLLDHPTIAELAKVVNSVEVVTEEQNLLTEPSDLPQVNIVQQNNEMEAIRPFVKDDIPQVADLHVWAFQGRNEPSPPSLRSYFEEIFFNNPWYDEELPSLVYHDNNGKVVGFLGVFPRRMSLNGQPIKVAISAQLFAEPTKRSTMAGVQLLKKFFSGPQDLSMTDGANDVSRKIWEGLGGTTSLLYSLEWTRLLRPSRYVMSLLRKRRKLLPFASVLMPFCHIVDAIVTRIPQSHFRQIAPPNGEEELTEETFLTYFSEFTSSHLLRPEFDDLSLKWLLEMAAQMKRYGTFRKVLVRNTKQEIIGWYFYYLNPRSVGQVLQIVAKNNSINEVLDHLFYHAWRHGVIALSGQIEPRFIQAFSDKYCLYKRSGVWMLVHSNKPELLQTISRGDAFLTRLEGEWWMRFQADRFI